MTGMPDLRRLPIVVTAPGIYRTRNGGRARVHEVKPYPDGDVTAFTVKGSVERMFRGKMRFSSYDIWHPSGYAYSFKETGRDLMELIDA